MIRRLCIILVNSGSRDPADCAMPIMHALTACALDCEVEMHFAGPAVRLLLGAAPDPAGPESAGVLADLVAQLRGASANGVRLYACPAALRRHASVEAPLADFCSGVAGAATYLGRVLDPEWRTLTY